MKLDPLLERLDYGGATTVTPSTLAALQEAFLLRVPFENLDIHWGRPLSLRPDDLVDKIVHRRRGGFCYENNLLLSLLLKELGFSVRLLSARMRNSQGEGFGPVYDHMALMVRLDRDYLVDVGNGRSFRRPLALDGSDEDEAEGRRYRVQERNGDLALLESPPGGPWMPRFLFTLHGRRPSDFAAMCVYHQTSPDSPFTRGIVATLARPDGRVTLRGSALDLETPSGRQVVQLEDEGRILAALDEHFGIRP